MSYGGRRWCLELHGALLRVGALDRVDQCMPFDRMLEVGCEWLGSIERFGEASVRLRNVERGAGWNVLWYECETARRVHWLQRIFAARTVQFDRTLVEGTTREHERSSIAKYLQAR